MSELLDQIRGITDCYTEGMKQGANLNAENIRYVIGQIEAWIEGEKIGLNASDPKDISPAETAKNRIENYRHLIDVLRRSL